MFGQPQILVALLLVHGPEATPTPANARAPAGEQTSAEQFDLALFRTRGLVAADLQAELELRMPEVELRPHAEAGALSEREAAYLYLETHAKTPTLHEIAVIVSDGRAYYGEVAVDEGLRAERVVASTIANLVFSIQQGTVAPDRQDATIPPIREAPSADEPSTAPAAAAPPVTHEPASKLELAVTPGLGYALGLGPPRHGDAYLGFGGGVGVELRTARGVHAFADFRALGRSVDAYRITRLRAALGAGFAWRRERLELVTDLGVSVEPWVVSSGDGIQPVTREDGRASRPPLLCAFLRLSPGYHVPLDAGAIRGLRIGPRVDIAGGFVPAPDPRVASVNTPGGRELFRLGGAELTTGVELVVWMGR